MTLSETETAIYVQGATCTLSVLAARFLAENFGLEPVAVAATASVNELLTFTAVGVVEPEPNV